MFLVSGVNLPTIDQALAAGGGSASNLVVDNLHSGDGDACGPVVLTEATPETKPNCDRDYMFGNDFGVDASFFDRHATEELYTLQDAHDPNDHTWAHNMFSEVHVPPAVTAHIYCFVPIGDGGDGHSHGEDLWPNALDPEGGWLDTGITFGSNRQLFTKDVRGGSGGASYVLYHSVTQGHGYLYVVGLEAAPVIDLGFIDLHTDGDGCGPILIPNADPDTPGNCDRDYRLGANFGIGPEFFRGKGNMYLMQDARKLACCALPCAPRHLVSHAG